jgi:CHAT domain-containing protein
MSIGGSSITVADGAITLTGQGGTTAAGNGGIDIRANSVLQSTGDRPITLQGTGGTGTNGGDNYGIGIDSSNIRSTGNGRIDLTGIAGNSSSGDHNEGIVIGGSASRGLVSSVDGDIFLEGTGGSSSSGSGNVGVVLLDNGQVESTGSGNITLRGANGTGGSSHGIEVGQTNGNAIVRSANGNITLQGRAENLQGFGAGVLIYSILGDTGSRVEATGAGSIVLEGFSRFGSGVAVQGTNTAAGAARVSAATGNVSIAGTAAGTNPFFSYGIGIFNAAVESSGAIALTGNSQGNIPGIGLDNSFVNPDGDRSLSISLTGDTRFRDPLDLRADTIDLTGGTLTGLGANTPLTLQANQIATDDIINRGQPITLTSNGILTTGNLDSSSISGDGGTITLTATGDITTGDLDSRSENTIGNSERGGDIAVTTTNGDIDTSQGTVNTSAANGVGGAIALTANGGEIQTGNLDSSAAADGGAIALSANRIATGDITAQSTRTGNGGSVQMNSATSINTGEINVDTLPGNAGEIALTAAENVTLNSLSASALSTGGTAGTIRVTSRTGAILSEPDSTLRTTSVSGQGGDIALIANRRIAVGNINTSSQQSSGGDIFIDPEGDVSVNTLNTQGGEAGVGGSVDITAGRFFRATGEFRDRNGRLASISTAGGQGGGDITIRHGGNGETPFIVGEASENGTTAAITTGNSTIAPRQSYRFAYTQDNIQLLTAGSPTPVPTPTPNPTVIPPISPPDLVPPVQPPITPDNPSQAGGVDTVFVIEDPLNRVFNNHLNLEETPTKSLADVQRDLQAIEAATGIRPAIIYVYFVSNESETNASPQVKSNRPDALWQLTSQRLAADSIAQQQIEQSDSSNRSDRLELAIVTARGQVIRRRVSVTRGEVEQAADQLRATVAQSSTRANRYLPFAQQLYQWLVAPLEADLQEQEIQNLTFILDAKLRSLPLAVLHDSNGYIIERYSVGLMPSLSLTDTRYVDIRNARVLAMGASEFDELADLPAVPVEVSAIADYWGGESLVNEGFTPATLVSEREINPFGIVHLATHGAFQPGSLQNSYIQFWDQKLRLDQVQQLRLNDPPVELLVLSACQMALGDELAELGFAGAAARTGVKSVLVSLWQVSDLATLGLMTEFYRQLQQVPIKAEAVRQAQLSLLRGEVRLESDRLRLSTGEAIALPPELATTGEADFSHPYYWSAFTLVGNPW